MVSYTLLYFAVPGGARAQSNFLVRVRPGRGLVKAVFKSRTEVETHIK